MNALNTFEICERRGRCEKRGTSKGSRIRGINGESAGNSTKKQRKAAESSGKRMGSCGNCESCVRYGRRESSDKAAKRSETQRKAIITRENPQESAKAAKVVNGVKDVKTATSRQTE